MSRDNIEEPLKGEDLEAARRIQKIIRKLDKFSFDHPFSWTASIHIEHAIRGVRCNGVQDRNNFLETAEELEQSKRKLLDTAEDIEKAIPLINEALGIFNVRYKRCPECKGKGGELVYGKGAGIVPWYDCTSCLGYGTVRVKVPSHIPKVQHKLYKKIKERKEVRKNEIGKV